MNAREWVCYWAATNCLGRDLDRNFQWMQTWAKENPNSVLLYDPDLMSEMLNQGTLLKLAVDATVSTIQTRLEADAIAQFSDWDIPMDRYRYGIDFDSYSAEITFTHRENGVTLTLDDVFFSLQGEILQCVHKF